MAIPRATLGVIPAQAGIHLSLRALSRVKMEPRPSPGRVVTKSHGDSVLIPSLGVIPAQAGIHLFFCAPGRVKMDPGRSQSRRRPGPRRRIVPSPPSSTSSPSGLTRGSTQTRQNADLHMGPPVKPEDDETG